MSSFYDRYIMPRFICWACASPPMMKQRAKIVPQATGKVLELGIGGGLNLAYYDPAKVTSVTGVDPSAELRDRAVLAPHDPALKVEVTAGTAEALPFPDAAFDTVVCTFTLCSVASPQAALAQARRVLKPGGHLLFCEHGLAPDAGIARWQTRVEPVWKRIAGGCHLTRPVGSAIRDAGFHLDRLDSMYVPNTPKIAGWNEWGVATPA